MSSVTISIAVCVDCQPCDVELRVVDAHVRRAGRAPPREVEVRERGAVDVERAALGQVVGRDPAVVLARERLGLLGLALPAGARAGARRRSRSNSSSTACTFTSTRPLPGVCDRVYPRRCGRTGPHLANGVGPLEWGDSRALTPSRWCAPEAARRSGGRHSSRVRARQRPAVPSIAMIWIGRPISECSAAWSCVRGGGAWPYCLMDNHVHLLIETPEANLGSGMQRLHGLRAGLQRAPRPSRTRLPRPLRGGADHVGRAVVDSRGVHRQQPRGRGIVRTARGLALEQPRGGAWGTPRLTGSMSRRCTMGSDPLSRPPLKGSDPYSQPAGTSRPSVRRRP